MEITEEIRNLEFGRLKDVVYLDHAGATLYSKTQLDAYHEDLLCNLYGNPHSSNPSSRLSTETVDQIRHRILEFFNTNSDEYSVIFTSGATGALKLVAECFKFSSCSQNVDEGGTDSAMNKQNPVFCYLEDNHTSVVGMRELASSNGAKFVCLELSNMENHECTFTEKLASTINVCSGTSIGESNAKSCHYNNLFVYPAQSNFSGTKYPLTWVNLVKKLKNNSYVLLDAANYCSTSFLDLSLFQPDFIAISFYKLFGFPTGLGALLVKKSSETLLQKNYFGGGTVQMSVTKERIHVNKIRIEERFEDGTIPFLDIISLRHGFEALLSIGGPMKYISSHTFGLARYVFTSLKSLQHYNGQPVVKLYHDTDFTDEKKQGPIVNFNIFLQDGTYLGFSQVDKLAQLHSIHLRTGCFCNMGACQWHLKINTHTIIENFKAGHVCGDDKDLINGQPTGSARISFGYMSNINDAQAFVKFIKDCFVVTLESITSSISLLDTLKTIPKDIGGNSRQALTLSKMFLYPVKSCAGLEVNVWPVGCRGFLYDRQWMFISSAGVCLTQKAEPGLSQIKPAIDLDRRILRLQFQGVDHIEIPLSQENTSECRSKVCGDRVCGLDCGDAVSTWVSHVLGRPGCRMIQQTQNDPRSSRSRKTNLQTEGQLSFANESQFLLITENSVRNLCQNTEEQYRETINLDNMVRRFRPNLVVKGSSIFEEDHWKTVQISNYMFKVSGRCNRCKMICVDPDSGRLCRSVLQALANYKERKMTFGIHLSFSDVGNVDSIQLSIGDKINAQYQ